MKMNKKTKFSLAVLSGIIQHLTFSSALRIGSLSVYYVSYLTKYNRFHTLFDGVLMQPICTFSLTLSVALGGFLERKMGSSLTIVLSCIVVLSGIALLDFCSFHIAVGYSAMVLIGMGTGISYLLTVKNSCLYYPEKKGMISSIIMSLGQMGGPIYAVIAETIINPNSDIIPQDDWKFSSDVSQNFFIYLKFVYFVLPIGTILTLITFIKYDESFNDDDEIDLIDREFSSGLSEKESSKETNQQQQEQPIIVKSKKQERYKRNLKKIFGSKRVYTIGTIYFLSAFLYFLIMGTSKTIGSLSHFNTDLLKYSIMVGGIILCFMGPVWGWLYDKFHFKILINVVNGAGLAIGLLMIASLMNEWFFAMMTIVNGLFFVGMMNIFNPHVMKIFTIEYSMEIAGALSSANGLSNILGSVFALVISKVLGNENQIKYAYIAIYSVGALLNLISLFISKYENDIPFDFGEGISMDERGVEEKPTAGEKAMVEVDLGINDSSKDT